jgi:hypothetical protein
MAAPTDSSTVLADTLKKNNMEKRKNKQDLLCITDEGTKELPLRIVLQLTADSGYSIFAGTIDGRLYFRDFLKQPFRDVALIR